MRTAYFPDPCEDEIFLIYFDYSLPSDVTTTSKTAATLPECFAECVTASCTAFDLTSSACELYIDTSTPGEPEEKEGTILGRLPECKYFESNYTREKTL